MSKTTNKIITIGLIGAGLYLLSEKTGFFGALSSWSSGQIATNQANTDKELQIIEKTLPLIVEKETIKAETKVINAETKNIRSTGRNVRTDTRQEEKTERTDIRQEEKTERTEERQKLATSVQTAFTGAIRTTGKFIQEQPTKALKGAIMGAGTTKIKETVSAGISKAKDLFSNIKSKLLKN